MCFEGSQSMIPPQQIQLQATEPNPTKFIFSNSSVFQVSVSKEENKGRNFDKTKKVKVNIVRSNVLSRTSQTMYEGEKRK